MADEDDSQPVVDAADEYDEELDEVMDAQEENRVTDAVFDSGEDLENKVQAVLDYQHGSDDEQYARDGKVKANNSKALETAAEVLGPDASTDELMTVAQQLQGQNAGAMGVSGVNGVDVTDVDDGDYAQRFMNNDYASEVPDGGQVAGAQPDTEGAAADWGYVLGRVSSMSEGSNSTGVGVVAGQYMEEGVAPNELDYDTLVDDLTQHYSNVHEHEGAVTDAVTSDVHKLEQVFTELYQEE